MKKILLGIALLQLTGVNAQIELDSGLVAHFPFNGSYNDISTNSITGTNTGANFSTDRIGLASHAIELTGSDFVSFSSDSVKPNFPLTISVWAKFNSFAEFNNIFFSDSDYSNYSGYWLQVISGTGQPTINFGGGVSGSGGTGQNNRRSYVSDTILQTGTWYSIVAIIRGHDDMDIYVDCVQTTGTYSGTGPTTISYLPSESRIGSAPPNVSNTSGGFSNGSIDQLAIWSRELTAQEITEMCSINNTLAINNLEKSTFQLFPNPARSHISISNFSSEIDNISILDVTGKLISTFEPNSDVIDVSMLHQGVYFIQVQSEGKMSTKRFIKQ